MSSNTILLGLNIDHCATLRQARYRDAGRDCGQMVEPDPVALALSAERAGVDGITVHLREDRRHIQESDVRRLRECIQTRLNLEMACTDDMVRFALNVKPEFVCLVPEGREEVSTEGGLDVNGQRERVGNIVETFNANGIATSLFINPEPEQIKAAAEMKSPFIELHTGAYGNAYYDLEARRSELQKLRLGAEQAHDLGITVNAGHGINYINIAEIRQLPQLYELNIGHSIMSRALYYGIKEAVREMKQRMNLTAE